MSCCRVGRCGRPQTASRRGDMTSIRRFCVLSLFVLAPCMWSQTRENLHAPTEDKRAYAGAWWAAADSEERAGFLNGVADCMTWTAHKPGFSATPEQMTEKITAFYQTHPETMTLSVIDIWERVEDHSKPVKEKAESAETWKNPHWYLNGEWWMQISEREQLGFVEGYLWCLRTQVRENGESYSHPAISYQQKIDAFVKANPKLGNEAVAVTLRRFRDKATIAAPK